MASMAMTLLLLIPLLTKLKSAVALSVFPFQNTSIAWEDRVNDLVDRLTLQELVDQMAFGGGGPPAPGIPRLGIPPYQYNTECLRGIVNLKSTSFPQAIGLAASFSYELIYAMAEAVGTEARGIFNNASAHGDYSQMKGVSCFAPFINLVRHPLWGRVQEVYGEDPYLSGLLASAYVRGLQGSHPRYMRASSGCKVVGLYSGPENIPVSRFSFNAVASERDLRLSYFPQFKACIEAGTMNLMCSYYRLNGIPTCTDKWLLKDVMRNEYGFKGYYVTDCGALQSYVDSQKYFKSYLESAAAAANAGVNLECGGDNPALHLLVEAVEKHMVSEETIRAGVMPQLYTRMRLGLFDPADDNPYTKILPSVIQSPMHRELAILVATKTYVLLKNNGPILPLKAGIGTLAVVGPMADSLGELYGNYAPVVMPEFAQTPLAGLRSLAKTVNYAAGCDNPSCKAYNATAISAAVSSADVVIVCLGLGTALEQEDTDRSNMNLPGHQLELLTDAMINSKQPIVLLIFAAGPLDISVAKQNTKVGAILQCFYPAQATGEALRRVLAVGTNGEIVSPAARMPYTWPASLDQIPSMINYSMEGRTYRYFKGPGDPLYSFGYGLSYYNFTYSDLKIVPAVVNPGTNFTVSVNIMNIGPINGGASDEVRNKIDNDLSHSEVVQLYIRWRDSPVVMPQLQLIAVRRVLDIKAGQTIPITFTVNADHLRIWDDTKGFIYHPGVIDVFVGGQQPGQKTSISSNVLQGQLTVGSGFDAFYGDLETILNKIKNGD